MAPRPVPLGAKVRRPKQRDQDIQGIRKAVPSRSAKNSVAKKVLVGLEDAQPRKSPQRLKEHNIDSTSPRRSSRLLRHTDPSITTFGSVELTTSKRSREAEITTSSPELEPAPKRRRLAATSVTTPVEFQTIGAFRTAYWREHLTWPSKEQETEMDRYREIVQQALARKKSTTSLRRKRSDAGDQGDTAPSGTTPSRTTSDQLRDQKSAPYKHPRYEGQLQERGSFMDDCKDGITSESKQLCQTLLKARFDPPKETVFSDDDLFKKTIKRLRGENEAKVIRDIGQLVVPSAEILADRGAKHLEICRETINAGWINCIPFYGPRPQPDFSLGFKREAFSGEQLQKLGPFIGNELEDCSYIAATYNMYFPFLTSEAKCGASALDIADRQNAHSQTVALRNLFQLFRLVGREQELHRQIKGFSFAYNNVDVRVCGHYVLINDGEATYYRHQITQFNFSPTEEGDHRWKAYNFVLKLYESWVPEHFKFICSAIDEIPPDLDFEVSTIQSGSQVPDNEIPYSRSTLSQQLEGYNITEARVTPDGEARADADVLLTPDPTEATNDQPKSPERKKRKDERRNDG